MDRIIWYSEPSQVTIDSRGKQSFDSFPQCVDYIRGCRMSNVSHTYDHHPVPDHSASCKSYTTREFRSLSNRLSADGRSLFRMSVFAQQVVVKETFFRPKLAK